MSIYEYDEEREMRLIRADEREIGREEERKKTEEALKKAEENIKGMISLCQEFGRTKEETIEKLVEKCNLDKKTATEKVKLYWE